MDAPEKSRGGDVESFYESLKELNEEKFCPFLKSCSIDLTRDYFLKICNTNGYASCQHFAKRLGELRTPINWLWKIAVEKETSVQE